jgi:glycosyltransferase involved in cell wall biosynthesis
MSDVSVIITTYKADNRLVNAINSVLNQTYKDVQIYIVDDNDPLSVDRDFTEKLMKDFLQYPNIHYIKHEKNKNGAAARNTGIKASDGKYIAFLDDDDWYYPSKIETSVNILETNNDYDAVYSSVEVFRGECCVKMREATLSGNIWRELLLNEGLLGTGSNMFLKRTCVDEIGYFDERFIRYQDVEYMLRYLQKYKIYAVNEVLIRRNIKLSEKSNIPDYLKFKSNKKLIFEKFDCLIKKLSETGQKQFFEKHYLALYHSALLSCNREYIKEAYNDLIENGYKLSMIERCKKLFPKVYKMYLNMRLGYYI